MHNLNTILQQCPVSIFIMLLILIFSLVGFISNSLFMSMVHHPNSMIKNHEYQRVLLSGLVHNDLFHLFVNEAMVFCVCGNLEELLRKKSSFGSLQFLIIYVASHLTGILATSIRNFRRFEYSSAGASGSVIGCAMAFIILDPNYIGFYLPVIGGVKNVFVGLMIIVGLLIYQKRSNNSMMDNELHFYSALGGIVTIFIMFPHVVI